MFSRQKAQTDIKKSTQKILDCKKDLPTRLKHLRLLLDCLDGAEAKALFCQHYSPLYQIVYDGIIAAEASLKQKGGFLSSTNWSHSFSDTRPFSLVHRAQREELESVLYLFEKILVLCPDFLHCRWQLHSISRLMAKLNHPMNSLRLRREAIRLFLLWYQCLGSSAPNYVDLLYSSLVPGLGHGFVWPPVSEDANWGVTPLEITPILPANPHDRQPEDLTSYLLECILDYMVSQAPKIHWKDGAQMWAKSIDFLYEKFKEFYLPRIFPNFNIVTDIYKPVLELPEPRFGTEVPSITVCNCQVVLIKWIANYAHSVYRSSDCFQPSMIWNSQASSIKAEHPTPPSSLSGDRDSITSYSSLPSDVDANVLAKDVILGTRENINLLHEIFRRALLMNFVHSAAIRRVICVYKDWIQINVPELPVFMLEPENYDCTDDATELPNIDTPKNRLRTDSYYGAIGFNANNNREEYLSHLRAGAQKILRIFFCNSASVFLLFQLPNKGKENLEFLEEQVDTCKRVLNIYRYAVMNTRMDPRTWEQLLIVMLHITSKVLVHHSTNKENKHSESLGAKLAAPLFQTLIVSWVKGSLNVPISLDLWDQLQSILTQFTDFEELITEWAKTMETLTRVLTRHVYNLDLANLPLDRLTEQKTKKRRGLQSCQFSKDAFKQVSGIPEGTTFPRIRQLSSSNSTERKSVAVPLTCISQKKNGLKRSFSEGNLAVVRKIEEKSNASNNNMIETVDIPLRSWKKRVRKMSRSMESLRKLARDNFRGIQSPGVQGEWAEISSSTVSLENVSNLHADGDSLVASVGSNDASRHELVGVIAGGNIKGWLPSVAAILWKRMLGILGNVNDFTSPKTHALFFSVVKEMWNTLYKVRRNQGVSLDNLSTPQPNELVPPLLLLAPWCIQALELPKEYHRGKIAACSLLCDIIMSNQDVDLESEYLCKFYASLHRCIIMNDQDLVNEVVRKCGLRIISKMMPGFSLLLLDLVQSAHSVLSCDNLSSSPRMEASTLLGTILGVSGTFKDLKVLQPNSMQFQQIPVQHTKLVLSYLIRTAKLEKTSHARVIALQSLIIYTCGQLLEIRHSGYPPTNMICDEKEYQQGIIEIFSVLLSSIKVVNRSVALVASDLLLFLSEFTDEVSTYFGTICTDIVLELVLGLRNALPTKNSSWPSGRPVEVEKRLFTSLMLTLGEWCMKLPIKTLLVPLIDQDICLMSLVFEVLNMIIVGYRASDKMPDSSNSTNLKDFEQSIPFDDLHNLDSNRASKENNHRPETLLQEFEAMKLAAKNLIMHLTTQLGHFPVTNSASRCASMITESDDLTDSFVDDLSSRIFTLPNLQMFSLNNETLLTLIELPRQVPDEYGEENISSLKTSPTLVRVVLRDLSGKASWDTSYVLSSSEYTDEYTSTPLPVIVHPQEETHFHSTVTGFFFPQVGPRIGVRHRPVSRLPTVDDSADDLDNLEDLLQYMSHTSPECLLRVGEPLTTPWPSPQCLTPEQEDDVISSVVSERNAELDYLLKTDMDVTLRAKPFSSRAEFRSDRSEQDENFVSLGSLFKTGYTSSFLWSRRLFSQMGLNGWEKRSNVYLLNKDEKLLRELKHLDNQKCREVHKFAVIYVAPGQEDKQSILYNTAGSQAYEDFVAGLGWEVDLENHTGFMGGLLKNKSSGETAPYYATSFTEVIFHVATRFPSNTEESLLQKTRHLGNDEVHIVWTEHNREYRRDIIPTEFCDVLIVIYPLESGFYRVQVNRKPEVPYFGPLYNEAVINGDILPSLVRATAINASRARRSCLQYYQHHFQERTKSLSTIIQNHRVRNTFEQFACGVFCPILPSALLQPGTNNRSSATSFTSVSRASSGNNSNSFGSVMLDHSINSNCGPGSGPTRRMTTSFFSSSSSAYENVTLTPNLGRGNPSQISVGDVSVSSASAPVSPVPPIPPKRLSVKLASGFKPKINTPPASPSITRSPGSSK